MSARPVRPARVLVGLLVAVAAVAAAPPPALAGEADVIAVEAHCTTIGTCDFDATVLHADVGFSHYADRFEVLAPDGEVLGVRVLEHPHVHEQPFVRRLVGVGIPDGTTEVIVRAHDSQHGYGGREMRVKLELPAAAPPRPDAPAAEGSPPRPAPETAAVAPR